MAKSWCPRPPVTGEKGEEEQASFSFSLPPLFLPRSPCPQTVTCVLHPQCSAGRLACHLSPVSGLCLWGGVSVLSPRADGPQGAATRSAFFPAPSQPFGMIHCTRGGPRTKEPAPPGSAADLSREQCAPSRPPEAPGALSASPALSHPFHSVCCNRWALRSRGCGSKRGGLGRKRSVQTAGLPAPGIGLGLRCRGNPTGCFLPDPLHLHHDPQRHLGLLTLFN